MSQQIRVVKCYKCVTFQVDIVKKAKKWTCKMCGESQTLKQEFGRGSGAECRKLVQELNMNKCEFEQIAHDILQKIDANEIEIPNFILENHQPEVTIQTNCNQHSKGSKWEPFIESPENHSDRCENVIEENESKLNNGINTKRDYERKSYQSEIIEYHNELSEDPEPFQSISSFNFNKKAKFDFDNPMHVKSKNCFKPSIRAPKTMVVTSNSKWGNFLSNSDDEKE